MTIESADKLSPLECPICESEGCQPFQSKGSWVHARCLSCGSVFVLCPPDEIALTELYQKKAGYTVPVHQSVEAHEEIIRTGLDYLGKADPKVFDVGCASGNFLAQFPKACKLFGCDVNEYDIALARDRGLDGVYVGRIEDVVLPGETFDWVHLGDVLEHVPDPVGLLKSSLALAKSGTLVTVSTPDMDSWWAQFTFRADRIIGGGSSVLSPPYHLVNMTGRAIVTLAGELGLEVVASWSRPPSFSYEVQSACQIPLNQIRGVRDWMRLAWIRFIYGIGFGANAILRRFTFLTHRDLHLTIFFKKA